MLRFAQFITCLFHSVGPVTKALYETMDFTLISVLTVSFLGSLYLSLGIIRGCDGVLLKIVKICFVLVPVIGPVFYYLAIGTPKRNSFEEQDRINPYTHMDAVGRANFRDKWEARKPGLEEKIRKLKNKLDED